MTSHSGQRAASRGVPDCHDPLLVSRDQIGRLSRVKRSFLDSHLLIVKGEQFFAGQGVPDFHLAVITPRSQTLPVRTKGHALYFAGMSFKIKSLPSTGCVPYFRGLIGPTRCQQCAVGTESYGVDPAFVTLQP